MTGQTEAMLRLAMLALLVPDYDEAIRHYVGDLGFELIEDTELSSDKRWVVVRPGESGADILLAQAVGSDQRAVIGNQFGGRVGLFLQTDDFTGVHDRLVSSGVLFEGPPRSEAYGTVAVFTDRYGNRWDLIGRNAEGAP